MALSTATPRLSPVLDRFAWTVDVKGAAAQQLKFTVPIEHEALVSPRADAALVGLLLPAMRVGKDLHVGGVVTDELLYNVRGPVQDWVCSILPMYRRVTVTADSVETPRLPRPAGVATGFSAGIDSFSALGDYLFSDAVPPSLKVTHLLFNDVGSHSSGEDLAASRLAGIRGLSEGWGAPVVDVASNLDSFFHEIGPNTAFMNTHTVRNAAVAHLLAKGLRAWYYASGYAFRDLHGGPSETTAASDSISLPLLSTSALRLQSVGSEYSRVEKTLQVARMEVAQQGLDVCVDGDTGRERNCSHCWKCLQVLVTLEIAGVLGSFCPKRFDMGTYLENRSRAMTEILSREHPHDQEIIELAQERNFDWPRPVLRKAAVAKMKKRSIGAARAVKRQMAR